MVSDVYIICMAYESGVGHGFQNDNLINPYKEGTDPYEAYEYGVAEGNSQREELRGK